MVRTIAISLIALLFLVLLSCEKEPAETIPDPSQEEQTDSEGGNDNNGKTLVVFYSFTGNCKTLSSALARYAEADMLEIQPAEDGLDYAANNYAIGSRLIAAIREKPNEATSYPAIKPVDRNVADYETIIIITPLWWGNMAAIMQSYLFKEGSKMSDKKIGLIVSSASSSISSVVADAKRLVPDAQWMGEALWINNSNRNKSDELIKEWWNGLSKSKDNMPNEIKITVSKKTLSVKIEDNAATKALVDALREASISYEANDYGGFEKVGGLGRTLPSSDSQITTQPGDVVLYNSNQIVLFYGSNSWSYTRIGKIQYGSLEELKSFLQAGKGTVSVTLSL